MPAKVHDARIRDAIVARVKKLTPETRGHWGAMSVDQMLWHVSQAMAADLGDGVWVDHPMFGPTMGEEVSRLHAKHFDHHLRQFGA